MINGKELSDSGLILSSVQKGSRSEALSPGENLQFDCLLGDQFKEPGTYRVFWKGVVSNPQKSCSGSCPKQPVDLLVCQLRNRPRGINAAAKLNVLG